LLQNKAWEISGKEQTGEQTKFQAIDLANEYVINNLDYLRMLP
jgi:hypothetical protein